MWIQSQTILYVEFDFKHIPGSRKERKREKSGKPLLFHCIVVGYEMKSKKTQLKGKECKRCGKTFSNIFFMH